VSRPAARNSWATFPRPNPGARLRLFCFPYAGGGASVFNSWPRDLPPEVEVCAVQPPGREGRLGEAPFNDVHSLVESAVVGLAPYFDRPFAFFGHSNGAVIAFELMRRLRRGGGALPVAFFPSGRPAPQLPRTVPPIHALPEPEFVEGLRRLRGTPEEVLANPELMAIISPLLRADFAISETYVYRDEPPFAIPMTAFGGAQDEDVSAEGLDAWRVQTTGEFGALIFPGGHFFIRDDRDRVLAELSAELRRVQ
jgi:medium-chain acyl-[acyl-carrier-protein] hydrolase